MLLQVSITRGCNNTSTTVFEAGITRVPGSAGICSGGFVARVAETQF